MQIQKLNSTSHYTDDSDSIYLNHIQILQRAFQSVEGYLEFRTFLDGENDPQIRRRFISIRSDIRELEEVATWLRTENQQRRGIFIGVNPRVREGGKSQDIEVVTTAFADLDTEKAGISKEHAIDEVRETSPIEPDLIVNSGGGIHVVYFVKPTSDFDGWKNLQKALYEKFKHLGADPAVVTDRSRVLRLAPSRNWKYDRDIGGREAALIQFHARESALSIEALSHLFDVLPEDKKHKRSRLPKSIKNGERNNLLFRETAALIGRDWPQENTLDAILKINREVCEVPLDVAEVERIVNGAYRRYEPSLDFYSGIDSVNNGDSSLFVPWREMSQAEYGELDYLIYGLPRGSVGMVSGVSNLGKSTFGRGVGF
jgi:hypothetical protein